MSSTPGTMVRLDPRAVASRPGPAGTAAAKRRRLASELEGLQKALALTRRMLDGESDAAPSVEATSAAAVSTFVPARRAGGPPPPRPRRGSPARVLRLPA